MVAKTGDSKDIRAVKADDGVELHYEVLGDGPPRRVMLIYWRATWRKGRGIPC
jgi:hypothetical protein